MSEGLSRVLPIPSVQVEGEDPSREGFGSASLQGSLQWQSLLDSVYSATRSRRYAARYCASATLQSLVDAAFGNALAIGTSAHGRNNGLIGWLIIGGVFMVGGRGWCLFFRPLAMSNLAHKAGSKLGMYRTETRQDQCADCKSCKDLCPMWAINEDKSIERRPLHKLQRVRKLCKGILASGREECGRAKQN